MKLVDRIVGSFCILVAAVIAVILYNVFAELGAYSSRGVMHVVVWILIAHGLILLGIGFGWVGYWMISDNPATLRSLWQQWCTSTRRSQIPTLLLTGLSAPLAFWYLGGWRVFVPIAVVGIGFDILFSLLNPQMANLREFDLFPFLPVDTAPHWWVRLVGLVYFLHALRYLYAYNAGICKGCSRDDLQSFKWGWYVGIALSYGLALVYVGAFVFLSTLEWGGSVWKAVSLCLWSLYLCHYAMRWIQKRLLDVLARRYSAEPQEFAAYHSFQYPNYLL